MVELFLLQIKVYTDPETRKLMGMAFICLMQKLILSAVVLLVSCWVILIVGDLVYSVNFPR